MSTARCFDWTSASSGRSRQQERYRPDLPSSLPNLLWISVPDAEDKERVLRWTRMNDGLRPASSAGDVDEKLPRTSYCATIHLGFELCDTESKVLDPSPEV